MYNVYAKSKLGYQIKNTIEVNSGGNWQQGANSGPFVLLADTPAQIQEPILITVLPTVDCYVRQAGDLDFDIRVLSGDLVSVSNGMILKANTYWKLILEGIKANSVPPGYVDFWGYNDQYLWCEGVSSTGFLYTVNVTFLGVR